MIQTSVSVAYVASIIQDQDSGIGAPVCAQRWCWVYGRLVEAKADLKHSVLSEQTVLLSRWFQATTVLGKSGIAVRQLSFSGRSFVPGYVFSANVCRDRRVDLNQIELKTSLGF